LWKEKKKEKKKKENHFSIWEKVHENGSGLQVRSSLISPSSTLLAALSLSLCSSSDRRVNLQFREASPPFLCCIHLSFWPRESSFSQIQVTIVSLCSFLVPICYQFIIVSHLDFSLFWTCKLEFMWIPFVTNLGFSHLLLIYCCFAFPSFEP
jgi:hypothetical protein